MTTDFNLYLLADLETVLVLTDALHRADEEMADAENCHNTLWAHQAYFARAEALDGLAALRAKAAAAKAAGVAYDG